MRRTLLKLTVLPLAGLAGQAASAEQQTTLACCLVIPAVAVSAASAMKTASEPFLDALRRQAGLERFSAVQPDVRLPSLDAVLHALPDAGDKTRCEVLLDSRICTLEKTERRTDPGDRDIRLSRAPQPPR